MKIYSIEWTRANTKQAAIGAFFAVLLSGVLPLKVLNLIGCGAAIVLAAQIVTGNIDCEVPKMFESKKQLHNTEIIQPISTQIEHRSPKVDGFFRYIIHSYNGKYRRAYEIENRNSINSFACEVA